MSNFDDWLQDEPWPDESDPDKYSNGTDAEPCDIEKGW